MKRELNLLHIICISTGAMISSGLFILPGLAFREAGVGVIFAYFLAGLFAIPAVVSKAELTTAMPKAGGMYFFIDRSFGPLVGTFGGIAAWLSLSFKSAFALIGMSVFVKLIYPEIGEMEIKVIALVLCIGFTWVNWLNIKIAGKVQVALVGVLVGILGVYVVKGLEEIQMERYFTIKGESGLALLGVAGFVFVSYGGLTKIAAIAEEIKKPAHTIPLGMLISLLLVMIIYLTVVFVTVGIVPAEKLASSTTPISLGGSIILGKFGKILLAIAGILAFSSTANAGIMTAARNPMAMGEDNILPKMFAKIHQKRGVPSWSILTTGGLMVCILLFLDLEYLIKTASSLKILLFLLSNLAVISMRESKIKNYRPKFVSPFYPWIQGIGILGYTLLLIQMKWVSLFTIIVLGIFTTIWYLIYVRPKVGRESSIVYVIERITSKEITQGLLRKELREILRERDEIIEDRFDRLIYNCKILDIKKKMKMKEFFKIVAQIEGKRLKIKENIIFGKLLTRERESSTIIAPGVAIPHITIEGKGKFDIIVTRARDGILFEENSQPVHTIFTIIGTRDERNFHLKVLAAIAQIVEDASFNKNWFKAERIEELRDALLLVKRRRID